MMKTGKSQIELLWCIGLLLLIPIWMGVAPAWYEWYARPENGAWMKNIYELLDGNFLVNIPLCIILVYVAYRYATYIWKDYNARWYRPILAILGLIILFYDSSVTYATVVFSVSYRLALTILLSAILLVMLIKSGREQWHNIQKTYGERKHGKESESGKEVKPRGFTIDNNEDDIPESLKEYAGEIVSRLLETDIKKHSFSLGVTGEWGQGKTTFLEELKKKIGDDADIVDFNPWMCSSPEQVTSDFFTSLRHQLSNKYSMLSSPIKDYAKYVNNVALAPNPNFSLEAMLPVKQESLFEKKKVLSEQFSTLPKPVVVVIDDVDRLERDEVFEVLRLIRNTADLSNIIYMVAYDREYVTDVLKGKDIKDASAYLEKIFPVEVHLPKVEEHLVWNTLEKEIRAQCSIGDNFADSLFKRLGSDDKELILRVLDNYRRAKRFARLYMLNMAYLHQQTKNELKLLDVFWLELLQMYDKKTYNVLADEPDVLLFNDGEKYRIKEGILSTTIIDENIKYEGETFWREETPKILDKMFGRYVKTIKQSICFTENYEKFFTLSVSPFRLSVKEMNSLFESGEKPEELMDKWLKGGKFFSSIIYQFKQIDVNKLNDEQLKSYLCGLLYFNMRVAPYGRIHTLEAKKMLIGKRYSRGANKAHDIVMEWFNVMTNKDEMLQAVSKMLNRLYITETINADGNSEKMDALLVSNEEVVSLLVRVMKTYLTNHQELTALDIMQEKGELPQIFRNCCVTVKDAKMTEDYIYYEQVAFGVVTSHFAEKREKPTKDEYDQAMGDMFVVDDDLPVFENVPDDEDQYWYFVQETYENNMHEYFGSDYDKKEGGTLTEFREKCFVDSDEEWNGMLNNKI